MNSRSDFLRQISTAYEPARTASMENAEGKKAKQELQKREALPTQCPAGKCALR
jgi:hypothetical protein